MASSATLTPPASPAPLVLDVPADDPGEEGPAAAPRGRRATQVAVSAIGLVLLMLVSGFAHSRALHAFYWIDEGISVGISSHPLSSIPGLLRQDGSPPLYYFLLHEWILAFGRSEQATHALSLVIALLTIPAALWAGWSLMGRRAGWICAVLAALNPFIGNYAQETRMYGLVVLLSLLTSATLLHALVDGRRRYAYVSAFLLALLLYTHDWGAFLGVAMVATVLVAMRGADHRRVLIDAAIAFGGAALLFAPWVPTLLFQVRHTGAPWSLPPTYRAVSQIPRTLLGGAKPTYICLAAAAFGLIWVLRRGSIRERRTLLLGATLLIVAMATAYVSGKFSPAWTGRYFSLFLGPLLLLLALGIARARYLGLAALVAVSIFWTYGIRTPARTFKSNVAYAAQTISPSLRHGDLVLATHPEEIPVLHHYMRPGLHYATLLGRVPDPNVMDWRNALARLEQTSVSGSLEPLLASVAPGTRVAFFVPVIRRPSDWRAPWTKLIRQRSIQWTRALSHDPRFQLLGYLPRDVQRLKTNVPVRVYLYEKGSS